MCDDDDPFLLLVDSATYQKATRPLYRFTSYPLGCIWGVRYSLFSAHVDDKMTLRGDTPHLCTTEEACEYTYSVLDATRLSAHDDERNSHNKRGNKPVS